MRVTAYCYWDWKVFSLPTIEMGTIVGYPYIMLRIFWFWAMLGFHKNYEDADD